MWDHGCLLLKDKNATLERVWHNVTLKNLETCHLYMAAQTMNTYIFMVADCSNQWLWWNYDVHKKWKYISTYETKKW